MQYRPTRRQAERAVFSWTSRPSIGLYRPTDLQSRNDGCLPLRRAAFRRLHSDIIDEEIRLMRLYLVEQARELIACNRQIVTHGNSLKAITRRGRKILCAS